MEIPLENRPRERLKKNGVSVLSDAELLAIILQNGTKEENVIDMSNRLISKYGLDKLSDCSIKELQLIKGVGEAKAMQVIALFELSKRVRGGSIAEKVVKNSEDVAKYYIEKLKDKKKEYFYALLLDSKNRIIKEELISIGTLNSSLVHPREVFKEAIKSSANAIILVHNHPSGDCEPSKADEHIADRFDEGGKLIKIKVVDFVIIGKENFYSFREKAKLI